MEYSPKSLPFAKGGEEGFLACRESKSPSVPLFKGGGFVPGLQPLFGKGEGEIFRRSEGELWLELLGQVIDS
jgi:hypothetical protein